MGLNISQNALAYLVMLFVIIGAALIFTTFNQVDIQLRTVINNTGIDVSGESGYMYKYDTYKQTVLSGFLLILYLFVVMTILSSFLDASSFEMYMVGSVAGFFMTAILVYLTSYIWNSIVGVGILDFSDVASLMWFVTNLPTLFFVNLLAGLMSFVFAAIKRRNSYAPPVY